jgi:hypothetical protein
MPESMMMAETGVTWKVAGKRRVIAAAGPRPGKTPTSVPMTTPRKQNRRFWGWNATWNPVITLWNRSITAPLRTPKALWEAET